jgi:hypothetical protein
MRQANYGRFTPSPQLWRLASRSSSSASLLPNRG